MGSYNIAIDCIDRPAAGPLAEKRALTCIADDDRLTATSFSFRQLREETDCFASALRQKGIKAGDRLLLRLANEFAFPISFIGGIKAGAIPIPTSPLLTENELEFLVDDSGAVATITENFFNELSDSKDSNWETAPTVADDPAYWLYTSGTAGVPKEVIHAHRSIPAHDDRVQRWQNLRSGDVVFNTSALNWSYALTCGLLDPWRHGIGVVTYAGSPEPAALLEIIQREQVTVFMTVPGIYRRLVHYLQETKQSLGRLRVCLSAGEALGEETRQTFCELTGLTIYEGLGMTEQSVYLAQPYGEEPMVGSCGRPLVTNEIAILREDLKPAKTGETGILAIHRRAPGLMLGYHQRSAEEENAWQGDWFLSGDLVSQDEAGNVFFVGRRDDVITAGGYRISPLEVEGVLNQHPAVAESAVVERDVEPGKRIVVAFIVPALGPSAAPESILAFAAERLARYKLPREIIFREKLPKTRNGKLKRGCLKNT